MPLRLSAFALTPIASALLAVLPACGNKAVNPPSSPAPAPVTTSAPIPAEPAVNPLDLIEKHVSEGIAHVVESAVALEYTAADAKGGARRVASGVVIGQGDEILSVRIDAPPSPPSDASPIVAQVASGRRLPATWVAADSETGLTLLKIDPGFARPVAPSPRGARLGIPVLVIGNPFGLGQSVNRGYVAGLDRRLELGPRQLGGLIQVDVSLHPGDSGALVSDLQGGWLGVVRSGLASPSKSDRDRDHDHDRDLGFAIPAPDALWVANQLRAQGRVDRAYLGVTMDLTAPALPAGAVLGRVLSETPAERAGLKSGDRVIALDGLPIRTPFDLTDRLDRTPADAQVSLSLIRPAAPSPEAPLLLTIHTARRPPYDPPRRPKPHPEDPRPPVPPEVTSLIDRLERRVKDLEKEKAKQDVTSTHPQER